MNKSKYQEALNRFDKWTRKYFEGTEFEIKEDYHEMILLQELVDKATTYKPKGKFYTMKECKCKNTVYRHHKYCHECGQALYWSEDE